MPAWTFGCVCVGAPAVCALRCTQYSEFEVGMQQLAGSVILDWYEFARDNESVVLWNVFGDLGVKSQESSQLADRLWTHDSAL